MRRRIESLYNSSVLVKFLMKVFIFHRFAEQFVQRRMRIKQVSETFVKKPAQNTINMVSNCLLETLQLFGRVDVDKTESRIRPFDPDPFVFLEPEAELAISALNERTDSRQQ